jgi:Uma2 family endonuclease
MSTITEPKATTRTKPKPDVGELRFVIYNVGWEGYEALRKLVGNQGPRLYYSRGNIELMSPLLPHEGFGKRLGRMVEAIGEELAIPIRPSRSLTLRREDVDRGAEADESYYIANVARVGHLTQINLDVDPPPDLVIEVEITSGILDKLDIYARLGVPEIWRFDGEILTVLILQPDRTYATSVKSIVFPFLPMDVFVQFVLDPDYSDESRWARSFRNWVRDVLLPMDRNRVEPE